MVKEKPNISLYRESRFISQDFIGNAWRDSNPSYEIRWSDDIDDHRLSFLERATIRGMYLGRNGTLCFVDSTKIDDAKKSIGKIEIGEGVDFKYHYLISIKSMPPNGNLPPELVEFMESEGCKKYP